MDQAEIRPEMDQAKIRLEMDQAKIRLARLWTGNRNLKDSNFSKE
jgi:hypothetical protein